MITLSVFQLHHHHS